jgi:hypothetical protein
MLRDWRKEWLYRRLGDTLNLLMKSLRVESGLTSRLNSREFIEKRKL